MDAEFQFGMIKKILEVDDDDDNVNLLNVTEIKMVKMVNCMLCIFSKNKKIHQNPTNKTKKPLGGSGVVPRLQERPESKESECSTKTSPSGQVSVEWGCPERCTRDSEKKSQVFCSPGNFAATLLD